MTGYAPDALAALIAAHGPVVRVVVAEAHGSAPREPGAAMTVWAEGFDGTVGGGALEWEALAEARRMLPGGAPSIRRYPLGPALGQCCGGATTLIYERIETVAAPQTTADAPVHARPVSPDAPAAPAGLPQGMEVPAPAAGRASRRAGRVKTRLLGFGSAQEAVSDPFAAAPATPNTDAAPGAPAQPVLYPVG